MSNNVFKSSNIHLFGAGASLPAKLPDIGKMTKEFFTNHILNDSAYKSIKSKIMILKYITAKEFENQFDLESFTTLIINLQNDRMRKLLDNKYPELSEVDNPELDKIKIIVQNFIRQKLEAFDAKSVEYLRPLIGLSQSIENHVCGIS